jgi:FAD/FMN-containing dehydrogenase
MKRRQSIRLINAGFLTLSIPRLFNTWPLTNENHAEDLIREFAKQKGIKYVQDKPARQNFEKDFGNILQAIPLAILIPNSVEQIQQILLFAKENRFHIVARGAGHSQSGQSLPAARGITVDFRALNQIDGIVKDQEGNDIIICQPGTTLQQVNNYLVTKNYMLPAQPFFPDLTIGGVLSAGGVGSASHSYGLLISNVTELEVLTGDGQLVTCSSLKQPEIFYGVLGTFGHIGVIVKASIKVRTCKTMFRTFRYVYDSIDQWLSDYQLLLTRNVSNLQGICVRSKQNPQIWNFLLEVTFEGASDKEITNDAEKTGQLNFKNTLPSSEHSPEEFLNRYAQRFEQMRTQRKFEQQHPFLEFVVSLETIKPLIEETLRVIPAAYEDGFRLIFIDQKNLPPYFIVPPAERICMFAILPTGIVQQDSISALQGAKHIHDHAMSLGATRYLSGWLGMLPEHELKTHFGKKFPGLKAAKIKSDPHNILRSLFSDKFFK